MATSTANADDTKDKTARNELLELAASASAAEDVIQRVPSIDGEQVSSMSSVVTEREAMSIHSVVPQVAVLQTASMVTLNEAKSFPQTMAQIPEREPAAINYIPIQKPLSPVREITEIPLQTALKTAFIDVDRDAQQELPPTYTYSADDSFDASGPPPISEEESRKYD